MNIQNILVVSPKYKEIQALIEKETLHNKFRFLREEDLTENDLEWADAFVGFNLKNDYNYSKVQWFHSLGAGVDRLLFKKQWDENVLLTRTICSFGERIAEYCLSYILKDIQYHDQFYQFQEQKSWQPLTPGLVKDQKIVIYGTGEIGHKTAKILSFFGAQVYGVSLSGAQKKYFKEVISIDHHLSRLCDVNYVINTLPLTEKTERIFNHEFFSQLSNSYFINVGRGASVDEQALLKGLDEKNVRFAVLDVFPIEPLPEQNELWSHRNVLITPHISAVTTPEEGVQCFLETLKNIEGNKPIHNKVDISKGF